MHWIFNREESLKKKYLPITFFKVAEISPFLLWNKKKIEVILEGERYRVSWNVSWVGSDGSVKIAVRTGCIRK